jgi:hypothetical protein
MSISSVWRRKAMFARLRKAAGVVPLVDQSIVHIQVKQVRAYDGTLIDVISPLCSAAITVENVAAIHPYDSSDMGRMCLKCIQRRTSRPPFMVPL